ncbi:MAG: hypothetical protein KA403_02915 [Candidatus Omnitrophica bacterium]|nr:hypothetical protein [Candidatus Omnitrophota bacterium]
MTYWIRRLMLLCVISTPALAFADSMSLTTYYPAPFGSYSLLRLTPVPDASMGACDTSKTGQIFLSSDSNQLKLCTGIAWTTTGPWTYDPVGKFVFLTNSDTDTAYKAGIGVATPNARWHVKGLDDDNYGQLLIETTQNNAMLSFFNSSGATSTGNAAIMMSNVSDSEGLHFMINNDDRMIIDENGNIGIDNVAPNTNLHITGADNASYGQLEVQSTGSDARISLYNSSATATKRRGDIMMSQTVGAEGMRFLINGADKMVIDENGNVGIGALNPDALFQVNRPSATGTVSTAQFDNVNLIDEDDVTYTSNALCAGTNCRASDSNFSGIRLYSDTSNVRNLTLGVPYAAGDISTLSVNVGTAAQLVVSNTAVTTDSTVNVGIGVASPNYKLHVNGPIGGALDSAHPANTGQLQVNCATVAGKCYAVYAP